MAKVLELGDAPIACLALADFDRSVGPSGKPSKLPSAKRCWPAPRVRASSTESGRVVD